VNQESVKQKYVKRTNGETIEIGDLINCVHPLQVKNHKITRVTNHYAFAKVTDSFEMKFNRVYNEFGFTPLPRERWQQTQYTCYKKARKY
jgi:hypothetical protein